MTDDLIPNISRFLEQVEPFDKLEGSLLRKIASEVKITYLRKGDVVDPLNSLIGSPVQSTSKARSTEQPKYLYIIRTGSMEQRKSDGVLRARLGSEDLFGFTFLDDDVCEKNNYKAIAIENTLLYMIPHTVMETIFIHRPEYAEYFAAQAQIRLKSALNVVWSHKEKGIFIKKVSDIANNHIAKVKVSDSIQKVAHEMRIVQRSSIAVVCDKGKLVGLVTDRDMTKRVVADGHNINAPISEIMTPDPLTVTPDDLVLHAASLMMKNHIRGLPVIDGNNVVGILTTSHMVLNHRVQAIFLIEKINHATDIKTLASYNTERQAIFEAFVEGKVAPQVTAHIMTMILDAYNRRLIEIAIEKLGKPPCKFSWMVAGSHARNEVHMLSDQDNAIVLEDTVTEPDKVYFLQLSQYVSSGLAACGYPLCDGNYMAANRKWCQPKKVWKQYYKKWVANPQYDVLLNIFVFLEVRCIYGETDYIDELRESMHLNIRNNPRFLSVLVKEAVSRHPPLSIFNNLVLGKSGENNNVLNIKYFAINLIIDLGRIYGLAVECESTSTDERFKKANKRGFISDDIYMNIINAYHYILMFRQRNQLKALKQGEKPSNHINPDSFGSFERGHLKDAFRIISNLQDGAQLRFLDKV